MLFRSKLKDGQTIIEMSACPKSNDVVGLQDLYLQLDISNSTFEMVTDDIASGLDPSASNYIVSSSYSEGNLVRVGGPTDAGVSDLVVIGGGGIASPTTTTTTTTTSSTTASTSTTGSSGGSYGGGGTSGGGGGGGSSSGGGY